MTETSILPGVSPASDAGSPMGPVPPDLDGEGTDPRRRQLMILGLVAGIIVIAVAAYMFLSGGSSSPSATTTPPAPAPVQTTAPAHSGGGKATTPAKGATKPGTTLPRKSRTQLVRDPFHALVAAPVTGADSSPGASTSPTPVSNQTVAAVPPVTGTGTTPPVVVQTTPPSTTTTGQSTVGAPLWIKLISVQGTHAATFDVGYADHKFRRFKVISPSPTSARGTVFDGQWALLGVQGGTATIQEGDATPYDLNVGEAHSA